MRQRVMNMRQFYRLVESIASSVMRSLNEGRDDDGEYVDDANSDVTMSTAWGYDFADGEDSAGESDDAMTLRAGETDTEDAIDIEKNATAGNKISGKDPEIIKLAYAIYSYLSMYKNEVLSFSMKDKDTDKARAAFSAVSAQKKDSIPSRERKMRIATDYANIRNMAFNTAVSMAIFLWKKDYGTMAEVKWQAIKDGVLDNVDDFLNELFPMVAKNLVPEVDPMIHSNMTDKERAKVIQNAQASTVNTPISLGKNEEGVEQQTSIAGMVVKMLWNLARRACDSARKDKLIKGGNSTGRGEARVYEPTGLENVEGLDAKERDFVYLGFVKELLDKIRNRNSEGDQWAHLYYDTRFFRKGKENTPSQWRNMQKWMEEFANQYPNHTDDNEYQEKLQIAIRNLFDGKEADQSKVRSLFNAIQRNVNDTFRVLKQRKYRETDTDRFERENMPAPKFVNELRQMVSEKLYSLNEDDRQFVVETILSEGKKERRHSYTKEEGKLSKKSNTRTKKDAQSILSKKAVNASAIARQCKSLKHMSDDGRRSFISKIERGEVTPDDTLASEIENAFTNLYSN